MAAQMGKDGFISFATTSTGGTTGTTEKPTYIDSWSLNPDINLSEITAYGDLTKKYYPTLLGWTASANGTLDKASTEQQNLALLGMVETTGTMYTVWVHFHDSTGKWIGQSLLTGVTVNSQVGDKVGVSYNFQGTSGLAYV
jgi:hypothetical protein